MLAYRTPGVYFEWLDSRLHDIAAVRTDIAAFIGIAERGPLFTPVKVQSLSQFQSTFGGPAPNAYLAYSVAGFFTNGGDICWIVRVADPAIATAGLTNVPAGGATALVVQAISPGSWWRDMNVSVLRNGADRFTLTLRLPDGTQESWQNLSMQGPSIDLLDSTAWPLLRLAVFDRTLWSEDVTTTVALSAPDAFSLKIAGPNGREETFDGLSMDPASQSFAVNVLAGSTIVRARDLTDGKGPYGLPDPLAPNLRKGAALLAGDARFVGTMLSDATIDESLSGSKLAFVSIADVTRFPENTPDPTPGILPVGGADGLATLTVDHFLAGLAALENIDEIGIVAMPDMMPKPHQFSPPKPRQRDCRLITVFAPDPSVIPPEWPPEFDQSQISALQQALIQHCEFLKYRVAVLEMPSPDATTAEVLGWRAQFDSKYAALYHPWVEAPDPLELDGQLLRTVPPSGHVAGIYARCDLNRGVHKPPANEIVEGVMDLPLAVDDLDHADLNDMGVNVIRSQPGRGIRVMGARTLSSDTLWRYVNVRRLLIFIEKSIDASCQWTVFEPNNPDLWREIRRVTVSFLDDLFKRGMLDGSTADQAYKVICDETTNPPEETDAGRMICEIGVQPPWPAEFVIVRIGKMDDRTLILENTGGGNG